MNSVAPTVVADTNSLWNFAVVERLDIVEDQIGHRIAWTASVSDEIDESAHYEPALLQIASCGWLGDPYQFSHPDCLRDIARIQRVLAAPGDRPTKHLGEAEGIHYIQHELGGVGILLTDDLPAADLARRRRLDVMSTPDLLQMAYAVGELLCPEPFQLLTTMADDHNRGVQVPDHHSDIC